MSHTGPSASGPNGVALYASIGPALTHYSVDVDAAALTKGGTVTLPAKVQYAWLHVSRRYLYVVSSNSASGMGSSGDRHHITAFAIDPVSGALTSHGEPKSLPARPIHVTTDMPSEHVLIAFSNPGVVRVYRIRPDGTVGDEVPQPGEIDAGTFTHQVRVMRDNRRVILTARGHDPAAGKPEMPGALKIFDYRNGVLTNGLSVAPDGGFGFGPHHLDFHPDRPWTYVSLERQNRLDMFDLSGDRWRQGALFSKDLLSGQIVAGSHQLAGPVHVHPDGRFVYGVNRAFSTAEIEGRAVFAGGENTIAVFSIDQATGEPVLIQHMDTGGFHCRTFHIDPSGRMLVAAHVIKMTVRENAGFRDVAAGLAMFRIAPDGRLRFVRSYDIEVGSESLFWMGMAG